MNATGPPKPAIILATPINVEESRAQRLQRQQARFRDRGGIFVPTNRSTLLDILLGKASPVKKPYRSASASPSRTDEAKTSTGNEISKPALRRSPRKQSQRPANVVTAIEPAAMTVDPELDVSKPVKMPTSSKSLGSRPQKKAKVPPKRLTNPKTRPPEFPEAFVIAEVPVFDTNASRVVKRRGTSHQPLNRTQKSTKKTVEKKSLKTSTKKSVPCADDDSENGVLLIKSKPKGRRGNKTIHQGEVEGANGTSKTRGQIPAIATTSAGSSRLKRTEKVEPVDSELSENEAACRPAKKTSSKKVKKPAAPMTKATSKTLSTQKGKRFSNTKKTAPYSQLPDISEGDEKYSSEKDMPPSCQSVKTSLLKDMPIGTRSGKSLNASDDDKPKGKVISGQGKCQGELNDVKRRLRPTKKMEFLHSELSEDDSVCKLAKNSSTKQQLEGGVVCEPSRKSIIRKVKASTVPKERQSCESSSSQKGKGASDVHGTAACQLPDIPEEGEEFNLKEEDTALSASSLDVVVYSKGKKRTCTSITQDSDLQPRRKRIKSAILQRDADLCLPNTSNISDKVPLLTSKKRRRNLEDAESGVKDGVDKSTKRKKLSGQSESRRASENPVEEDSAKPVGKRPGKMKMKTKKPARKSKKQSSDNAPTVSKRKENGFMSKPSKEKVKVVSNSGPPKSVLQRIKDSLGAQVVDNEPDPIDFLS